MNGAQGLTLDWFLDMLADRLAERMAARDDAPVDQRSPKGLRGRRHIEAVRRRVEAGLGGAWIRGRDFLLSPEAVREELARLTRGRGHGGAAPAAATARVPKPPKPKSPKAARAAAAAEIKRDLETAMRREREA